jgi:hypothetical protein
MAASNWTVLGEFGPSWFLPDLALVGITFRVRAFPTDAWSQRV